ncbi:helix-turn-helix domain-containing protein [Oscillatoria salina]|uniref:helix-turn-helix domain-containing protein n=1 Tax=Oscillatoria salina TaxID=331517 RepID=UPI001CCCE5C8|nr:helix-turn-helix domain-containing protein [Oscillatoria salina]MBZ8182235.1 helix-turn-helix domain-containing protein [Oscillatoria salina IIICB1]
MNKQKILLEPILPATKQEIQQLILGLLTPEEGVSLKIGNEKVYLPPSLCELLIQAAEIMADGKAVSLLPVSQTLSIEEAANFLNVSKSFLDKLLEEGKIPYSKMGVKKQINLSDLMAYKKQRDAQRRELMIELAQFSQEEELHEKNINS